jgi:hypothetical protein
MTMNATGDPPRHAPDGAIIDRALRGQEDEARFFVGYSTGEITMVPDEVVERRHMGD